jgi:CBS domain-containing protein
MTRDVVCVDPEMTVVDLRTLLLERNISGAPVVDAVGRPIGVVSKTDLVRALQEPDLYRTVRSIMMSLAFTLTESAPIARAAALMAYERVHRVVVISTEGSVVGIVSSLDVLNWLAQENGYLVRPRCA